MHELARLRGKRVVAADGAAGVLHDLFFDASDWRARYLATDSGVRGSVDRLLVPAVRATLDADGAIKVSLKRAQFGPRPGARSLAWLFSGRETARYAIEAADGFIGELDDWLIGPGWAVTGIALTPRDWLLPGWRVVLEPEHIAGIDRGRRSLHVRLSGAQVLRLPRLAGSV
jgi:hypothetical protein